MPALAIVPESFCKEFHYVKLISHAQQESWICTVLGLCGEKKPPPLEVQRYGNDKSDGR